MRSKMFYPSSLLPITKVSSTCDSSVNESTAADVANKIQLRLMFSMLKKRMINNYQRAVQAQIDRLTP